MQKYKVRVCLVEQTYTVDAENEEDAFIQASDLAMIGGCWDYEVEEVEKE